MNWVKTLFLSGTQNVQDSEFAKRITLINQVSFVFICAAIPFVATLSYFGYYPLALIAVPFVLIYMACIGLNKWGYHLLAQLFLIAGVSIPTYLYATILGKESGVQYVTLLLLAFSFGIFRADQKRLRVLFLILPPALFYGLYATHFYFPYQAHIPFEHGQFVFFISLTTIFILLYLILLFYSNLAGIYKKQIRQILVIYNLSNREGDIIFKIADGKTNKQIAEELFIEEGTVKHHLNSIFRKTGVKNRLELLSMVLKDGDANKKKPCD